MAKSRKSALAQGQDLAAATDTRAIVQAQRAVEYDGPQEQPAALAEEPAQVAEGAPVSRPARKPRGPNNPGAFAKHVVERIERARAQNIRLATWLTRWKENGSEAGEAFRAAEQANLALAEVLKWARLAHAAGQLRSRAGAPSKLVLGGQARVRERHRASYVPLLGEVIAEQVLDVVSFNGNTVLVKASDGTKLLLSRAHLQAV